MGIHMVIHMVIHMSLHMAHDMAHHIIIITIIRIRIIDNTLFKLISI